MSQVDIDISLLSESIDNLLNLLNEFEATLDQESDILKTSDTEKLTRIVTNKKLLSEKIEHTLKTLSKVTKQQDFSISQFIEQTNFKDLPQQIQELFKQVAKQTIKCHDKNIANGITLQSFTNLNDAFLQILKGQDTQSKTYTSSGSSTTSNTNSKPLGKA
jgi:flagellar biosynthesis/type III secretory pathway chaperone